MKPPNEVLQEQQQWLTRAWDKACEVMDKGTPLSEKGLKAYTEAMERFDAVEDSARRAGFTGCINGESCGEDLAVSCWVCVPPLDPSVTQPEKGAPTIGKSKSGKMFDIQILSF